MSSRSALDACMICSRVSVRMFAFEKSVWYPNLYSLTRFPDAVPLCARIGLAYGFGPLFALLVPVGIVMAARLRTKLSRFVVLTMLLSLASFAIASDISAVEISGVSFLSDLIRLTSTALPLVVGLGYLYSRLKPKYVFVALLVYLAIGAAFIPTLSNALQSSQNVTGAPVDRLSLNYRAPYYRMYQIASTSGRTLIVIPGGERGVYVYASMLPKVTLALIPPNQGNFSQLLGQGWNSIFLYSEGGPLTMSSVATYPSYYQSITFSHSYGGYVVKQLWNDSESYALQLVKQ